MKFLFPFLFCMLWILVERLAYAENGLSIESLPKVVRQGEVCLIRAKGPAFLASIYGEFNGEKFQMDFNTETAAHEGLLGIDMEVPDGTYDVKVIAKDREHRVYTRTLSLRVERVDFGTQFLSLPREMLDLDVKTLERVKQEAIKLETLFRTFRDEKLWKGAFIPPLNGEISAGFGLNRIINRLQRSRHTGVDLRAKEGTLVLASNHGIVVLVDDLFFSGKSVILDHGWGIYSMYFHLSEALVREGDRVPTGAILGRVGSTGRSTGPHLHWGMRVNGARVDPFSLLKIGAGLSSTDHLQKKD